MIDIERDDIRDFHSVADKLLNTTKLPINTLTAIKITQQSLLRGRIQTKKTYNDLDEWAEIEVGKRSVNLWPTSQ